MYVSVSCSYPSVGENTRMSVYLCRSLRQVKIEQRKLNDNSNSLVDMAKVRASVLDYRRHSNRCCSDDTPN